MSATTGPRRHVAVGDRRAEGLPPLPAAGAGRRAAQEAARIGTLLGPRLVRRPRDRSSGDGRGAKRPDLRPVEVPRPVH